MDQIHRSIARTDIFLALLFVRKRFPTGPMTIEAQMPDK
jgi:hypothetical protein